MATATVTAATSGRRQPLAGAAAGRPPAPAERRAAARHARRRPRADRRLPARRRSSRRCSRPTASPSCATPRARSAPSSRRRAEHLLGTTVGGYDVLSRVHLGRPDRAARDHRRRRCCRSSSASLSAWFAATSAAGSTGSSWSSADAIYAFPSLLLAIVMSIVISGGQSSLWGGILAAAISITVVFIPQYFRVIRAETVRIKAEPFVESAKVVGASSNRRIMFRHVLPQRHPHAAADLHAELPPRRS